MSRLSNPHCCAVVTLRESWWLMMGISNLCHPSDDLGSLNNHGQSNSSQAPYYINRFCKLDSCVLMCQEVTRGRTNAEEHTRETPRGNI